MNGLIQVEDILSLSWKAQLQGKREIIQARLWSVSDYLERWLPVFEEEREALALAPIDQSTADRRIELAFAQHKLNKAVKARKVLEKELERRGEV